MPPPLLSLSVLEVVEALPLPPPTMEDTFPQENPESLQKAVIECLEEELEVLSPFSVPRVCVCVCVCACAVMCALPSVLAVC
jgi:hypothetical protein